MKERGILFRGELVRKILDGDKDVTRRVIRPDWIRCLDLEDDDDCARALAMCPYGRRGDRLWVRETFYCDHCDYPDGPIEEMRGMLEFRADHDCRGWEAGCPCHDEDGRSSWRPSIHMPRWASRIDLEIVTVRAERLQDITVEDITREGLATTLREHDACRDLREQWIELWNKTNARRGFSWESNPWVWRIEFKLIEKAEASA